ncbi:MAG: hypothetical protein D3924_18065 [Candidatus Electrothrix sp. AR4]|nr:hypothetical protein [Candidatus Electrothrix sp. AR4]
MAVPVNGIYQKVCITFSGFPSTIKKITRQAARNPPINGARMRDNKPNEALKLNSKINKETSMLAATAKQ